MEEGSKKTGKSDVLMKHRPAMEEGGCNMKETRGCVVIDERLCMLSRSGGCADVISYNSQ